MIHRIALKFFLTPLPQKLHLPPELSETASRTQEDQDSTTATTQQGGKRKPLTLTTTESTDRGHTQSTETGKGIHVHVGAQGGAERPIMAETAVTVAGSGGSGRQLTGGSRTFHGGGGGAGGGVGSRAYKATTTTDRTVKLASHNIDF